MKLLKQKWFQTLLCWLAYLYMRLTYLTIRWRVEGFEELEDKMQRREPVILAFWHSRLLMMPNFSRQPDNIYVMISRHGDGELIARTIEHFKLRLIRGSSNRTSESEKGAKDRGGAGAIREAVNLLSSGHTVTITPDGPKGPRMRVASTIIDIAKMSGAPIYPVTYTARSAKLFQSWDRFLLPFPFTRGVFICGEPIALSDSADAEEVEKARNTLENRLNTITHTADAQMGIGPVEPEPATT